MKYFLVLLYLGLTQCGKNEVNTSSLERIQVYGDSVSIGFNIPEVQPVYGIIVAQTLNRTLQQHSIGGTSLLSQNQLPAVIQAQFDSHDTVLFAPGENDAILYGQDPSYLQKYSDGLWNLLLHLHSTNTRVYLGTPIHNCNEGRFVLNGIVDKYAQINRDLVSRVNDPKIKLVDYNSQFIPSLSNTIDCAHPNTQGNRELALVLLNSI